MIFRVTANLQRVGYHMKFLRYENGTAMQLHSLLDQYQREGDDFLGQIITLDKTWAHLCKPNLKRQSNEWKHPCSPRPKKVHPTEYAVRVMFIVAYCTSKADGKRCLLLHIPTAPPLSSIQEKTTMLGGIEPHYSSWQCKESHHCCCHAPLVLLTMGDSGTSTVLIRYESMRLQSLCQSERTTARDPVQHKRWIYPHYRAVNKEHQLIWMCWWFTTSSKHLAKDDKKGGGQYWKYINVVPLWIKPCQKYRSVAITFIQLL